MTNKVLQRRMRRKRRVSANIHGTSTRPRIVVFRSNRFDYIQAIDDDAAHTLASASSKDMKSKETKTNRAKEVGKLLADALKKKKITTAVFDRSRFSYEGRVKAIAESMREQGITI